jgi:bleomycin hydrolase
MDIIGFLKDDNVERNFNLKKSWRKDSSPVSKNGFIYMSEAYFNLKTISIIAHKDTSTKK